MKTESLVREFVRTHKIEARDAKRARIQLEDKRIKVVSSRDK
jgi:hypothetical protein